MASFPRYNTGMSPNEILAEMRGQPFEPKRICVSDGSEYDIYHPDMCMVLLTSIVVGIKGDTPPGIYEQAVRIDCRHVTGILPLPVTNPPGQNGPASPQ